MSATVLVLAWAAAFLVGLGAGIHVVGVLALNPALRAVDPTAYLAVKQSMDRRFPALMRPLSLAGVVALLVLTVLAAVDGHAGVAVPAGVGLVCAVLAVVAVLRGDLPINERMATWTADALPADWRDWRRRWERFFLVRTLAMLGASAAALTALANA